MEHFYMSTRTRNVICLLIASLVPLESHWHETLTLSSLNPWNDVLWQSLQHTSFLIHRNECILVSWLSILKMFSLMGHTLLSSFTFFNDSVISCLLDGIELSRVALISKSWKTFVGCGLVSLTSKGLRI